MNNQQQQQQQTNLLFDKILLAAGEHNPVFFANYFLGLELNKFQIRYLLETLNSKQNLLVTANQVGKTVAVAILHIWNNFYKKEFSGDPELIEKAYYSTLNISPVSRQSREAARYVEEILNSNFSWEKDGKRFVNQCKISWFWKGKNENFGRIEFSNNSAFYCLSTSEDKGANLQGAQFAYISYDEAPQSYHLEVELPARIFSRTAKYNGRVDLIGTPDEEGQSQQYWFHLFTEAEKGLGSWKLIKGEFDENIFIPKQKREEYKKRLKELSPEKYKQVIFGGFVTSEVKLFSPEMIEGLWNEKKEPTPAQPDRKYVVVSDWGVSDQGDETVMLVGDVTNLWEVEIVYAYAKKGGDPVELMAMAAFLKESYNNADLVMDTASMGGEIFRKMMFRSKPISYGQENKFDALTFLKMRLRNNLRENLTEEEKYANGRIKSYYLPKLEAQLASYKIEDKKIKQDWVMALCQIAWYCEKYAKQSQIKIYPLKIFSSKSDNGNCKSSFK